MDLFKLKIDYDIKYLSNFGRHDLDQLLTFKRLKFNQIQMTKIEILLNPKINI